MNMSWVKKSVLAAGGLLALVASTASAEDAAGDWVGLLAGQYHVVLHVAKDPAGHYSATLESPDQGNVILTVDEVTTNPGHLSFALSKIGAHYSGIWNPEAKGWVGTWAQGMSTRLVLSRMTGPVSSLTPPKRPQEDAIERGSLPYTSERVHFPNTAVSSVTLGGTFSKPAGTGPFPTVILIAGSGPNNRDEDLMGHKLFLVFADALNRRGIAVLRYDKRGIGESTGTYQTATTLDFSSDAAAALAWLKTRSDVELKRIGVLGHSEGGLIAPAVAAADPSVSFVVLMAGPGVRGDALLLKQRELIAHADGATDADIATSQTLGARAFAVIEASSDAADAKAKLEARAAQAVTAGLLSRAQADRNIAMITSPWMYAFLRYDPIPTLRKVRAPVLAINGSLDLQVEPKTNLAGIKSALANDDDVTVTELPGLNHLFQEAKTGSPNEYGDIEETMSPVALKTITDWIVAHAF